MSVHESGAGPETMQQFDLVAHVGYRERSAISELQRTSPGHALRLAQADPQPHLGVVADTYAYVYHPEFPQTDTAGAERFIAGARAAHMVLRLTGVDMVVPITEHGLDLRELAFGRDQDQRQEVELIATRAEAYAADSDAVWGNLFDSVQTLFGVHGTGDHFAVGFWSTLALVHQRIEDRNALISSFQSDINALNGPSPETISEIEEVLAGLLDCNDFDVKDKD